MRTRQWIRWTMVLASVLMMAACGGGGGAVTTNHAPVASAQSVTINEDTAAVIPLSGTDEDGDTLTYSLVSHPSHGTLSGTAPRLTYTPTPNWHGSDRFTFKVNDGTVDSAEAAVSITVSSVNDTPVAVAASYSMDANKPFQLTLSGSDIDGDTLSFETVDGPNDGTLTCNDAACVYEPDENFKGTDRFTYRVHDGTADSDTKTITLTVMERPFRITVRTDNPGVSANNEFTISTDSAGGTLTYAYRVDCGDGRGLSAEQDGDYTCTYGSAGEYTVSIYGQFPRIRNNRPGGGGTDSAKITGIEQWGTIRWKSMEDAFNTCDQLVSYHASDTPILTDVTNMSGMFKYSTFDADINDWDVSRVEKMGGLFADSSFNGNIGDWNTSNVQFMGMMFNYAANFNQDISRWDVSRVTDVYAMFNGATRFDQDIGDWDVSHVTTMRAMFSDAEAFNQDISGWDVGHVTDMAEMFNGATEFDQDLSRWNISNVTLMNYFLLDTAFSQVHYDKLLEKWSALPIQNNVHLHVPSTLSCSASAKQYRTKLIKDNHWSIYDANANDDYDDDGATDDDEIRQGTDPGDENEFIFITRVYRAVTVSGRRWLDRNLFADRVCTGINDSDCFGRYYQWGRRNGNRSSDTTTQYDTVATTGIRFVKTHHDWLMSGIDDNGNNRQNNWKNVDGTFTCPKHYRLPTVSEWENVSSGWNNNQDAFDSDLKLPSAGYRYWDDGNAYDKGSVMMMWTSTPSGTEKADIRNAKSTGVQSQSVYRAYGAPVRCIHEP